MKKIVIASDSFKGSLSSAEVAQAAAEGIRAACGTCGIISIAVADGGEGTSAALSAALGGEMVEATVHDPLMREIKASYGIVEDMAVIEMAAASGLPLLSPSERNPMVTTSYGTGELIMDALERGCRRFLVGIGGSATNDGGTGMLEALGVRFSDAKGRTLHGCGGSLADIAAIDCTAMDQRLNNASFTVACDVDTPFCGPEGAAETFAPQKGASAEQVRELDCGMQALQGVICKCTGIDISGVKGAGAAGGMGGAFKAFLRAELKNGIEMVLDAVSFDDIIKGADLVITGEGCLDSQTPKGKVPYGVLLRARKQGIPVAALGGSVKMCPELEGLGFAAVVKTSTGSTLEESMEPSRAAADVTAAAYGLICSLSRAQSS